MTGTGVLVIGRVHATPIPIVIIVKGPVLVPCGYNAVTGEHGRWELVQPHQPALLLF